MCYYKPFNKGAKVGPFTPKRPGQFAPKGLGQLSSNSSGQVGQDFQHGSLCYLHTNLRFAYDLHTQNMNKQLTTKRRTLYKYQ